MTEIDRANACCAARREHARRRRAARDPARLRVRGRPAHRGRATLAGGGGRGGVARLAARARPGHPASAPTRAARIAAAFELGRRAVEAEHHRDAARLRRRRVSLRRARASPACSRRCSSSIGVDIRNGLLDVVEVARGTLTRRRGPSARGVPPARPHGRGGRRRSSTTTRRAIRRPSHDDVELTRRLRAVGDVLGIPVIDHVVVGECCVPVDRRVDGPRAVTRWEACEVLYCSRAWRPPAAGSASPTGPVPVVTAVATPGRPTRRSRRGRTSRPTRTARVPCATAPSTAGATTAPVRSWSSPPASRRRP